MIQTFVKDNFKITVYGTVETPYFQAREIAILMGYKYPANAIQDNVDDEDKIDYSHLLKKQGGLETHHNKIQGPQIRAGTKMHPKTIFINESGLYSLIMSSKLPQAKEFKRWITSEVLPSIRKSGQYIDKPVKTHIQLSLQNEADLQKAIVNYLRSKYPQVYFNATLGELQDTSYKRITSYFMGYSKGSPDLFIFYRNRKYDGLAIEFKNPLGTGVLKKEQQARLNSLKLQKWDILVSNDIFEITEKIYSHINQNKIPPKAQKIKKLVMNKQSILDYVDNNDDIDEQELEEFNMEGLIDHYEDEGEYEVAECLAQQLHN